eukprot:CAMPEP_0202452528 /NCGR_PEP_ID=MMETSP1360-20130828/10724_1 /ASSEMBLY_ACC=CAM_ASM_000848 /TAXON_ID=515479 /ORGANISM="Licmophora paradoxa, Strain CCMP2313" /LENGTH=226 /DNA_ID=CAMNT_0049071377 /DNA_START=155 /DNA_END=831 /DNA_ORIENTATION=+
MDQGDLVPDQVMIDLVMSDATPQLEQGQSLLLDGFPRTQKQAQSLDEVVGVDLVINLDIPTETIVERIAHRWIHPASGRVYNLEYNPPKVPGLDNETGEPLVQRDDDKPESVRARLKSYETVTAPLVSYYESKGGGRGRGGGGVLKTFTGTQSDVIYPPCERMVDDDDDDDDDDGNNNNNTNTKSDRKQQIVAEFVFIYRGSKNKEENNKSNNNNNDNNILPMIKW